MSYYVHKVPGRVRIKSPFIKGNAAEAEKVEAWLLKQNGVETASANPVTGSIIVSYDVIRTGSKEILGLLEEVGYYEANKAVTADQYIGGGMAETVGKVISKALLGIAVEMAFEGTPLTLLAAIL